MRIQCRQDDISSTNVDVWTTPGTTQTYTATFDPLHNTISHNAGSAWSVNTLTPTTRTQKLIKRSRDERDNQEYLREQDGVSMPYVYVSIGATLLGEAGRTGTYEDGVIMWTTGMMYLTVSTSSTTGFALNT